MRALFVLWPSQQLTTLNIADILIITLLINYKMVLHYLVKIMFEVISFCSNVVGCIMILPWGTWTRCKFPYILSEGLLLNRPKCGQSSTSVLLWAAPNVVHRGEVRRIWWPHILASGQSTISFCEDSAARRRQLWTRRCPILLTIKASSCITSFNPRN